MAAVACLVASSLGVEYRDTRIVPFGAAPSDALQPWLNNENAWTHGVKGTVDDMFSGMFNDFHGEPLENGLPNFDAEDQLRADSVWSHYFMQVYGEIPAGVTSYPIKVRPLPDTTTALSESPLRLNAVCPVADYRLGNHLLEAPPRELPAEDVA